MEEVEVTNQELSYAQLACDNFGLVPQQYRITEIDAVDTLTDLIAAYDDVLNTLALPDQDKKKYDKEKLLRNISCVNIT